MRSINKETLDILFDLTPVPTVLTTMNDGKVLAFNKLFCDRMAHQPADLLYHTTIELKAYIEPDTRTKLMSLLKDKGFLHNYEVKLKNTKGEFLYVLISSELIKYRNETCILSAMTEITEYKKSEYELRSIEEKYSEMMKYAPSGIFKVDYRTQRFTSINDAMCKATGYSREELMVMNPIELIDDESKPEFISRIVKWLKGEKSESMVEYKIRKKDGELLYTLFNVTYTTDENGNPIGSFGIVHDITEKKKAEKALMESEKRYRELVKYAPTGIYEVDFRTFKFLSVNDAACILTGYSREELLSMGPADLMTPESRNRMLTRAAEWLKGKEPDDTVEYIILSKEGKQFDITISTTFTKDENGNPVGATGIVHDITERKRLERSIKESERRYRELVEFAPAGIYELDFRIDKFVSVNDAVCSLTGYSSEELLNMSPVDIMVPESRERIARRTAQWLNHERPDNTVDYKIITKDEREVDINIITTYKFGEDGIPCGATGIVHDITAIRKAEKALSESEKRYRELVKHAAAGIYEIDFRSGKFISVNDSMCILSGYSREDFQKMSAYDLLDDEGKNLFRDRVNKWLNGDKSEPYVEYKVKTKDGNEIFVLLDVNFISDDNGNPVGATVVGHDITERRKIEEALRESEKKYRQLVNIAPAGIFELDYSTMKFTSVNDIMCEMSGYTREELLSVNPIELIDDNSRRQFIIRTSKWLKGEESESSFEYRVRKKDGTEFYGLFYINFIKDKNGKPWGSTGVVHDITARKNAEEALRDSEERYRKIIENSQDAIIETDLSGEGRILAANPAACRMFGYTDTEIIRLARKDIINNDIIEVEEYLHKREINKYLKTEFKYIRKDGTLFDGELTSSFYRTVKGETKAIAFIRDITERKKAEAALRESEEQFRAMFEITSVGMTQADPETGRFIRVNKTFELMTGFSEVELMKMTFLDITYPSDTEQSIQLFTKLIRNEYSTIEFEKRIVSKEGKIIWILLTVNLVRDSYGKSLRTVAVVNDITERKNMEESLRQSEAFSRNMLETTPDAVFVTDLEGTITYCNEQASEQLGLQIEEAIGRSAFDSIAPEYHSIAMEGILETLQKGFIKGREYKLIRKDGSEYFGELNTTVIKDKDGNVTGFIGVLRDITNRRLIEEELRQANRLLEDRNSELDSFNYSASHDLRGPLRSVSSFSRILRDDYAKKLDKDGIIYINRIINAADKMAQLVDDLLMLSKITRVDINHVPSNMSEIAKEIANELLLNEPQRHVKFKIKDNLIVYADFGLITIVLDNLIKNAWKFTSRQNNAHIEFSSEVKDGKTIYCIRDNGAGFDMAFVDKLFTPFQRLHSENDFPGTGIGLTIIRRIIERHGGKVWAESETGKGTSFYFELPGIKIKTLTENNKRKYEPESDLIG